MRFVLIDRLVSLEPGHRATARVSFPPEAGFFADHFPGFPLVPGVLLTEAMGQTAGWLLAATAGFERWPLLTMVHEAKFMRQVAPGDDIDIAVELRSAQARAAVVTAVASVRGQRVARARLQFHEVDPPLDGSAATQFRDWAETVFRRLGGRALLPTSSGRGTTDA